jgi:hypothetical protein
MLSLSMKVVVENKSNNISLFIVLSVEETQYFASSLFALGFLVGHDTIGGTDQNVSKLTRRK